MKKPIIIILISLAVIVLIQDFLKAKKSQEPIAPRPYVIMVSLDGFRWDYQDKTATPHLDYISAHGVKASGLQSSFPTKTFPNHYSIATGLHPGNHGLVSNTFYDPKSKSVYSNRDKSKVTDGKFYWGEPIWVTAEAQKIKTASVYWVGTEAKIKGYRSSYFKAYDHSFPYGQRIDTVISWLKKPYLERPHLLTCYFDRADGVGHDFGPDSKEIENAIQELDSLIGVLLDKTAQLPMKDSINIIIVSDHGMAQVSKSKLVHLNDYLNEQWVKAMYGNSPFIMVEPQKKCTDSIIDALKNVEGIHAYKKENLPDRFHLKDNIRVSEIVVLADSSWSVEQKPRAKQYTGGNHGYDNLNNDMNGIFYSIGPSFKSNYNAGKLNNLDIYGLIARVLELKPATTDGDTARIMHVLK